MPNPVQQFDQSFILGSEQTIGKLNIKINVHLYINSYFKSYYSFMV